MKLEKIYLCAGVVAFQVGACMIHYGLGLMILGVFLLLSSYLEFEENEKEEEK